MLTHEPMLLLGRDENSIEVSTRVSAKAKKISIKVSPHKGVELVIPKHVRKDTAMRFLHSKEEWIIEKTREAQKTAKIPFKNGARIPINGEFFTIAHSGKLRGVTHLHHDSLLVSGPVEYIPRKVKAFLQELAKKELEARVAIETMKLGVKYQSVTVRDTSTRWGSCSEKGNLSFSWRLVCAPREVLEYVVAHEVAHLVEMNHSRAFWRLVEDIFPQHRAARKWLKDNGSSLHRIG